MGGSVVCYLIVVAIARKAKLNVGLIFYLVIDFTKISAVMTSSETPETVLFATMLYSKQYLLA